MGNDFGATAPHIEDGILKAQRRLPQVSRPYQNIPDASEMIDAARLRGVQPA